jgi:hypothetical protein
MNYRHTRGPEEAAVREETLRERTRRQTRERIKKHAAEREALDDRTRDFLGRSWSIERSVEADAAIAIGASLLAGKLFHRAFFAVAGVFAGLLLNFAATGRWPLTLFLAFGFKPTRGFDSEREGPDASPAGGDQALRDTDRDVGTGEGAYLHQDPVDPPLSPEQEVARPADAV